MNDLARTRCVTSYRYWISLLSSIWAYVVSLVSVSLVSDGLL